MGEAQFVGAILMGSPSAEAQLCAIERIPAPGFLRPE